MNNFNAVCPFNPREHLTSGRFRRYDLGFSSRNNFLEGLSKNPDVPKRKKVSARLTLALCQSFRIYESVENCIFVFTSDNVHCGLAKKFVNPNTKDRFRTFVEYSDQVFIFDTNTLTEVAIKLSEMQPRKISNFGDKQLEISPARRFYVDASSFEKAGGPPVPSSKREIDVNPSLIADVDFENELYDQFVPLEYRDYYSRCNNTFEMFSSQPDHELNTQCNVMLKESTEGTPTLFTEDEFFELFLGDVTSNQEFDATGSMVLCTIDVNLHDLLKQGTKNSTAAGLSENVHANKSNEGASKSMFYTEGALEAFAEYQRAGSKGYMIIRPDSQRYKDERVKPEKKTKCFQPSDMVMQKLVNVIDGTYADFSNNRPDKGIVAGASSTGGVLDMILRLSVAKWKGIKLSEVTPELLRDLPTIASDFVGFEYNLHPACHVLGYASKHARFAPGAPGVDGSPSRQNQILLGTLAEYEQLPDMRVGTNTTFMCGSGFRSSGRPGTLTDNCQDHSRMLFMLFIKEKPAFTEQEGVCITEGLKMGDDGLTLDTPAVLNLFDSAKKYGPFQLTAKQHPLITELDAAGEFIRQGADFCKNQFLLAEGDEGETIIVQGRHWKNLHKVARGNTSTLGRLSRLCGTYSHATQTPTAKWAYDMVKKRHEYLKEKLDLGPINPRDIMDAEDQPEMLTDGGSIIDFPSWESLQQGIKYQDPIKKIRVMQGKVRTAAHNIGIAY